MSNKILKGKNIGRFSIFVADLSPAEKEEFKIAFKTTEEEKQKKEREVAAEIKSKFEKAWKEGYEKGYKEGYNAGIKKGYQEGFQRGWKEGEEKGYQEGLQKGYKEGQKNAQEEYQKLKKELEHRYEAKFKEIDTFLQNLVSEAENSIINVDKHVFTLAKKIAEKLVLKTIHLDEEPILNLIKEALSYVAEGVKIKIKVNPEDYEILKGKLNLFSKNSEKIELIPEEGISKGGALIQTSLGVIDATLEKRWERVLEVLSDKE